MDLILWRHAEARPAREGEADAERELTGRGARQACLMAEWLAKRIEGRYDLLVSPALRTRQTAERLHHDFEICAELGTDSTARRMLKACGWSERPGTLILVGHRPGLNRLASLLMTGRESEWEMKKGSVWWFQSRGHGEPAALRAVMRPKDLQP